MNRCFADFVASLPCGIHVPGVRDRSMGNQRTQINNRTVNRGRVPMPWMCERRVCDSVDGNVNTAFHKMNCSRTA